MGYVPTHAKKLRGIVEVPLDDVYNLPDDMRVNMDYLVATEREYSNPHLRRYHEDEDFD